MTMRHSSLVGEASVKNKELEMAGTNSKNSEGEHKNISGYGAQAEMCVAEGGLM